MLTEDNLFFFTLLPSFGLMRHKPLQLNKRRKEEGTSNGLEFEKNSKRFDVLKQRLP